MLHTVLRFLLSSADFFHSKYLWGTKSSCQTVWIKIIPLVLIWIQTVFQYYQQMTKAAASKEIVKVMPWFTLVLLRNLLTTQT